MKCSGVLNGAKPGLSSLRRTDTSWPSSSARRKPLQVGLGHFDPSEARTGRTHPLKSVAITACHAGKAQFPFFQHRWRWAGGRRPLQRQHAGRLQHLLDSMVIQAALARV